jgi:hypothetical protein
MLTRREFLALALALAAAPARGARAQVERHRDAFAADVGILYGVLSFHLAGTIEETVDRAAGRYTVTIRGEGTGITNHVVSSGLLRDGRWAPLATRSRFVVHGRESRVDVEYDYGRRLATYHSRAETFILRRLRVADDVVPLHDGTHVDDVVSATLNYADRLWPRQPDGTLRTWVVRRQKPAGEGPDDVQRDYRAELVPFVLRTVTDPTTGRATALFDLTRFSSWAREDRPARIVFGPDRRPEAITTSLMLGTSVDIRIAAA